MYIIYIYIYIYIIQKHVDCFHLLQYIGILLAYAGVIPAALIQRHLLLLAFYIVLTKRCVTLVAKLINK